MNRVGTPVRVALSVAAFLASLSLVAWRQGRAFDVMTQLDEVREENSLAVAERAELERSVQWLRSRARVVPDARERLGMEVADAAQLVILDLEATP